MRRGAEAENERRTDTDVNGSDDPIKNTAPYMLQVVARLQTASYQARIAGCDVHPAGSYVLHELWRAEPLSQSELSRRLDIGNATVGQTLRRLERDGFVERDRSDGDKRLIMVRLTDKGRAAREPLERAAEQLAEEIDAELGVEGGRRFLQSLCHLARHFRSL